MKPLLESLESKESHKYSNIMFNEPLVNKWGMHKIVNYKESKENSTFVSNSKSIIKSKLGESKSKGCKACITPIVYDEIEIRARSAKALTTCVNSLAHPRGRFRPN